MNNSKRAGWHDQNHRMASPVRTKGGRGLPQSKTLSRQPGRIELPQGFGVRQPSAAFLSGRRGCRKLLIATRIAHTAFAIVLLSSCSFQQRGKSSRAEEAVIPAKEAKTEVALPEAVAAPPAPFEGEGWQSLFDGHSLAGWRQTAFAGQGEVSCRSGVILLNTGNPFTGMNYTNDFPKVNYEVALDAMRVAGSDFFCGLTVPVGDSFCSLIVGGWGGSLIGISSLDHMDASENETTHFINFEQGRWYRIRLRVTRDKIEAWLDKDKLVDVGIADRTVSLRPGEIEMSKPFGLASWETASAVREIKMRRVEGPDAPVKREQ